jgi:hypothetical protein
MRKAQATSREIGLASLLMIALALYLYFSIPRPPIPEPTFKEKCEFQGNFSCYSIFLKRGSSRLEIAITQNSGKLINVTSLVCTANSQPPAVMPLLNNTVLITAGERAYVGGGNSGNEVVCTREDGKSIPSAAVGDVYNGSIYLTYIEVKTGTVRFVNGTLVTKYS